MNKKVIVIVPYPCGSIFAIILIVMGIFTLPVDPGGGISTIIFGIIILAINQAMVGYGRQRGSPVGIRGTNSYSNRHSRGMGDEMVYYCQKCDIEFVLSNTSNLCPNCQLPLKTKESSFSEIKEQRKTFYFENQ